MKLEFDAMETTELTEFYGGKQCLRAKMFTDENNRIFRGVLAPGASIGYHRHDAGSEIVYVCSGTGTALYDDGREALFPGACHYCPKGHSHSLINDGGEDLVFFAVVPRQ